MNLDPGQEDTALAHEDSTSVNVMPADEAQKLSKLFRAYKRTASRLRDVLLDSQPEDLALTFELHAEHNQPVNASFIAGPEVARHAALLRPFMAPGSQLELRTVWDRLRATGMVDQKLQAAIEQEFVEADRLSISVKLNEGTLTAHDVYSAYGEGQYFADNEEAQRQLRGLSAGLMPAMIQMLFHDACAGYSRLVFLILDVILELEKSAVTPETLTEVDAQCIYCLKRDGDFSAEEHVIPESLGGDEIVIRGCVCSTCNNVLSRLDQTLLDFEAIAMLRPVYGPLTKKGKFPSARLGDVDLVKVAPREVRILPKTKQSSSPIEHLDDGTVRFCITGKGRKPFDPMPLARALFKVGLGLVAHDAGPEVAREARYDRARAFVLAADTAEPIPNHLIMSTTCTPHATISTWCIPSDGSTIIGLDIFGLCFGFNLEATPFGLPADDPPNGFVQFWLGNETDDTPDSPNQGVTTDRTGEPDRG
jgi:hypothetical protein